MEKILLKCVLLMMAGGTGFLFLLSYTAVLQQLGFINFYESVGTTPIQTYCISIISLLSTAGFVKWVIRLSPR